MSARPAARPVLVATVVDALLAGPWTAAAMVGRLAESVRPITGWADGLVRAVLAAYPLPPADRPREFAVFVDLQLPHPEERGSVDGPRADRGPGGDDRSGGRAWGHPRQDQGDDSVDLELPVGPADDDQPDREQVGLDLPVGPAEHEQADHEWASLEPPVGPAGAGRAGGGQTARDQADVGYPWSPDAEPPRVAVPSSPVVVRRLTSHGAMGPRRWPVPAVDDLAALAARLDLTIGELGWFADTRGCQRRDTRSALRHYRFSWVERPGRIPRLLEAPRPRLKTIQRRVLDGLLAPLPVHPAAHGFVAGRSVLTGARVHEGAALVLTMDLESFFSAVTAGRVYGVLRSAGYPEPVAYSLAGLCTLRTPVDVVRRMPAGPPAASSAAWRLGRRLGAPHLPQGSPTSPALANLVAYALDRRLADYAARAGWRYTRYADDLTFSAGAEHSPGVGPVSTADAARLAAAVTRTAASAGFQVHPGKTRIRGAHQRQLVTGLVVNRSAAVPRADYDRLRAVLHRCATTGPDGESGGHPRFREHLLGRIASVAESHPGRGERLRAAFARISWLV